MYLILFVLNDPDRLEDLLQAWEERGVRGATVMFSTGLGRIRQQGGLREDLPLIPSLSDFYEAPENMNHTIFTTVKDEADVDAILAATKQVIGDLDDQGTGLMLVLPVARAYGVNKREP